jgi:hypothetical protein
MFALAANNFRVAPGPKIRKKIRKLNYATLAPSAKPSGCSGLSFCMNARTESKSTPH